MSVINTNIQAIAGARNLNRSQEMLGRSLNRLSSGSKIVNPSDDAAGLAVSEKLDAQSRRVRAATTNAQNAISYVQTSDGFMSGMTKILSRMSELAILAQDVTKNATDTALYGEEFQALQDQLRQSIGGTVAQIGGTTAIDTPLGQFNGIKLLGSDTDPDIPATTSSPAASGSNNVIGAGVGFGSNVTLGNDVTIGDDVIIADDVTLEDGVTIDPGVRILTPGVTIPAGTRVRADMMPVTTGLNVTVGQAVGQTMNIPQINLRDGAMGSIIRQDSTGAYSLTLTDSDATAAITAAIQDVANERATLGASQSRLELAATTLQIEYENLSSAISRIRDVDVAEESTQLARYNILVQSGTAMLAQANQTPQTVLKLLQG
jgi:flagellin-like hook-associated protein FlgL